MCLKELFILVRDMFETYFHSTRPYLTWSRDRTKAQFSCWQLSDTDQLSTAVLFTSTLRKLWIQTLTEDHLKPIIRVGSSGKGLLDYFWDISWRFLDNFSASFGYSAFWKSAAMHFLPKWPCIHIMKWWCRYSVF